MAHARFGSRGNEALSIAHKHIFGEVVLRWWDGQIPSLNKLSWRYFSV